MRTLYPFEPLKEILEVLDRLGHGTSYSGPTAASETREEIVIIWKSRLRPLLLDELDRQIPSSFDSRYYN
jgi:hypothetical protein